MWRFLGVEEAWGGGLRRSGRWIWEAVCSDSWVWTAQGGGSGRPGEEVCGGQGGGSGRPYVAIPGCGGVREVDLGGLGRRSGEVREVDLGGRM